MNLSIITTPNRHGLFEGVAFSYIKDVLLANTTYEVLNCETACTPAGDRILLLGQKALNIFGGLDSLYNKRGEVFELHGRPCVATFDPQEAWDFKPEKISEVIKGKDTQVTQKKNWSFWIEADIRKLLGYRHETQEVFRPNVRPEITGITRLLNEINNEVVFIDIEVDRESDTLDCVGVAVNDSRIYTVPIYTYNGNLAYDRTLILKFLAAFSGALVRNKVVVHNAMFDLLWLASHLRLPFGRSIHDTMIVHKRIFAEVEKSLGHCISYWTNQPYHKDENVGGRDRDSQYAYWTYNAKDVHTMRLVYRAQVKWLEAQPAYRASVDQALASIYPYLLASLRGVAIDTTRMAVAKQISDKRIAHVKRVIHLLIGDKNFNPDSPKQLIDYFHKKLAYKVVGYTESGNESLGGKALYELALLYPNPLIQAILYYREIVKERSQMQFNNWIFPWKTL